MRDLAFAMIWVVLFPVALWSAHVGVLLWIWVALITPNEQLYGFMSGIQFNKIVAAVTVLVLFLNREKKRFYLDATVIAMVLIAVIATASELYALVPTDDGWNLYQKLLKEFALAILITGIMWTRNRLHMTVAVLCISLGFTSVVEGLEYVVSGGGHKILGTGAIGDNNSIALAVLLIIPPLYYLARWSEVKLVRLTMMAVALISVITVVGTFSRGGFVGLIVLALFLIGSAKNKIPAILVAGVIAALVVFAAPPEWFSRIDTISDTTGGAVGDGSFIGRVIAWKISTLIALNNPLLGGGFHAVQRFPVWMHFREAMAVLDFIPTPEADPLVPHAAHSIYFEMLGDLGFSGLVLFLTVLFASLYNCIWIVLRTRARSELFWAGDLARMLLVSLVIYMISGAALSMAYFEGFWILVAIISRLRRTVKLELVAAVRPHAAAQESVARGVRQPALAASRLMHAPVAHE